MVRRSSSVHCHDLGRIRKDPAGGRINAGLTSCPLHPGAVHYLEPDEVSGDTERVCSVCGRRVVVGHAVYGRLWKEGRCSG